MAERIHSRSRQVRSILAPNTNGLAEISCPSEKKRIPALSPLAISLGSFVMITADLFPDLFEPFTTTAHFSDAAIRAVEKTATRKGDKTYLRCLIRNREVLAKPEEVVRQLWLHTLIHRYKYPASRIQVEYPITFGRDSSKRADIVIFDADRPTIPYVIIEVKQPTAKGGKEQLKSYTHATGAPLAVWSDGTQVIVWHRKNPNYFEEIPSLPGAHETIEMIAGQPWTIDTLIDFEQQRDAEGAKGRTLRDKIQDMEDEVLANAGVDVFEEVFKLIFTKLYDELSCYSEESSHLRFRNVNSAAQMKAAIQSLYDEARAKWEGVFPVDDKIRLTPEHLQVCVGSLEQWKLFNSNLDVVDDAFEYLVNKSSKGEKGQYFTPRWVIDMCVKMLNPKENEPLIDTACGSAGFTMHSIFHVWRQILIDSGKQASHLFTMEKKPARCTKYVQDKVFAIDFDEKSVRVSRCLNLIAGDGQTNVLHLNTLDYKRWDETTKQPDWNDTYNEGWKKLRKLIAKKDDYRNFKFTVLMANPPFAGDIKQTDMLSPYELAHKLTKDGHPGKLETSVGRDLLFIERNLDFLAPGGRMAVVLPQGRFNNSSDQRVREYIADRCRILAVVGLHPNTFKPHTGTKTSVLFVQKWTEEELKTRSLIQIQIESDLEAELKGMEEAVKNREFGFSLSNPARNVVEEAQKKAASEKDVAAQRKRHKCAFADMGVEQLEFILKELETELTSTGGKVYYGVYSSIEKVVQALAAHNDFYAIRLVCEQLRDAFTKAFIAAHPRQAELDYNIFFATQRRESKDNSGSKLYETRLVKVWYEKDSKTGKWNATRRYASDEEFAAHNANPQMQPVLYEVMGDYYMMEVMDEAELHKRGYKYPASSSLRVRELTPYFYRERVRDEHGHWIVVHDLFSTQIHGSNGGGSTPAGIAEAFEEFAAKEKLSFF